MSPSRRSSRASDAPSPPRPTLPPTWPGAALALGLAAVARSCAPTPRVPAGVEAPPRPLERAPYVQAVQDDRAVLMWRMATAGASSRLRYRIGEGPWRPAEVRRGQGRDRHVVLEGLPRAAEVEFAVAAGDGAELGRHRFRTAPPDTSGAPVEVLAFGDSGWGSDAQVELARLMRGRAWDLAVHVGDLAYPDGSEEDFTVRHFRVYRPLFARVPLFPTPGNHDVDAAGGLDQAYDRAFRWPGEEGRRSYAFRWGRAQFVALDTSTDSAAAALADRDGRPFRWLEETLASAARDTTVAWTVVFTHRPLYSQAAGFSGHGPDRRLRRALEPLLLEHGVDLVLTGHDHHYQRSRPLRRGEPVPPGCGPVHFVTGGGGATRFARSITPEGPAARVSRDHHFLALELGRDSGSGEAVGRGGRVMDRFELEPYDPGGGSCPD